MAKSSKKAKKHQRQNSGLPTGLLALFSLLLIPGSSLPFPEKEPSLTLPPLWKPTPTTSIPHDTTAFTQGLLFWRGALFESTGRYGRSLVRRLDPTTGAALQQTRLGPQFFGEGIAHSRDEILQLTWKARTVFAYDPKTLAITARLRFPLPGEAWGITQDPSGTTFFASNGSARIFVLKRSKNGLRIRRTLSVKEQGVPVSELNELEWVEGEIWANIWHSERIVRIDPQSGQVLGYLDLSSLVQALPSPPTSEQVANGIAYDAAERKLFLTGKEWPKIFIVHLPK